MSIDSQKAIFIGCDHAGVDLKNEVITFLQGKGFSVEDFGTHSCESVDYPGIAAKVCDAVLAKQGYGILICGTGIGMSMAANRKQGIRAALCTHEFHAKATRAHNNANVLCLGARVTASGLACELVDMFLTTPFEGGRHIRRIDLLDTI